MGGGNSLKVTMEVIYGDSTGNLTHYTELQYHADGPPNSV